MTVRWLELADGVFARRHAELDLTVGVVLGGERVLVVDTRGDERQGAELAAAVRELTPLPVVVALTHAHFDHCFGTRALGEPVAVYAQRGCADALRASADAQRTEWSSYYRERGDEATARALESARIVLPDHPVGRRTELDLGGRPVQLRHPGPGHTDHDLAVWVPDAEVMFAGDLVEQGAPPDFTDADPLRWPASVRRLLEPGPGVVVPGHGAPVSASFVETQMAELEAVSKICSGIVSGTLTCSDALRRSPYPEYVTRMALARAIIGQGPG